MINSLSFLFIGFVIGWFVRMIIGFNKEKSRKELLWEKFKEGGL